MAKCENLTKIERLQPTQRKLFSEVKERVIRALYFQISTLEY